MKRILLLAVGFLSLSLGALGMFLPILPTTPFILVSSACFAGSSPRFYHWLASNPHFGPYIENYRNKTGIPKRAKRRGIGFLWITLGISFALFPIWYVRLILLIVGICVTIHLARLPIMEEVSKTKLDESRSA